MLAALLSLTMAVVPGCRAAQPGESQEVLPELKLEGVRFRVYRGDALRAVGEAGSVSLRRDSTRLFAADLAATLPRAGGDVRIAAPAGEGVISDRTYSASGGVTVARGDDVGRTARVRWEPAEPRGRVVGEEPIVLAGKGYRLEGAGFSFDPATSELTIRGDARLVAGRGEGR